DCSESLRDERPKDRLLGGLLSPEFDEASCLSRDQSAQYWKQSNHTPSPYLLQKLRNYESLHRRWPSECNYVVWLESGGIGNRVISMVSTFLYALLNDKVFLLKLPDDFHGIFCEPFPGTSHDYSGFDKMFYCEEGQRLLRRFAWLFLKSNRYYVPNAKQWIGIQVRMFGFAPFPFERMVSQSGYFEKIRNMYYEHSTTTGEVISVYQPSQEKEQHTEKQSHNVKALSEIYLLSFSDVLLTTTFSTFGYVAYGLGGVRPWLLLKPENDVDPSCRQSLSAEPCFHFRYSYDCKTRKHVDKGALVPCVKHCEDFTWGVKVVDETLVIRRH
ncbi:Xyloglucan fucosyltransferase, partial [Musa troglodytarum]